MSCKGADNYPPVENAFDAGRQFIDAVFKGNFRRAGMLILDDRQNSDLLKSKLQKAYNEKSSAEKAEISQSSIKILSAEEAVKDSLVFIHLINSYDQQPLTLKVIKQDGTWVIDLKYTFSGNL